VRDARSQYSGFVAFVTSKSFSQKPTTAVKPLEMGLFCCIFVRPTLSRRPRLLREDFVRHAQGREIRESRTHRSHYMGPPLSIADVEMMVLSG
jgi:hypothetical protein